MFLAPMSKSVDWRFVGLPPGLFCISLVYVSVFEPTPRHAVLLPVVLSYILKSDSVMVLTLSFLFKIALAFRGPLWLHKNCSNIFVNSVENVIGSFLEIAFNLYNHFG